jgi:hypothetical protein
LLAVCVYWGLALCEWLIGSPTEPVAVYAPTIDLGERELGEVVVARFQIANNGRRPLEVRNFRTSCACAGIEQMVASQLYLAEHVTVPPRSSVELFARIRVRAAPGQVERTLVWFQTNDLARPTGAITVEASRVVGIACSPSAVLFNDAIALESASQIVEVRNVGSDLARIESVTTNAPEIFRVRLLPADRTLDHGPQNEQSLGRLEVTLLARPPGNVGGEVLLSVASKSRSRVVTLPVSAIVADPVTVTPARLALPLASDRGRLFTGACLVRCARNRPITVRPKEVPADCLAEVSDPDVAAQTKLVRVKWTPAKEAAAGESYPQSRTLTFLVKEGTTEHRVAIQIDCSNPW